MGYFGFPGGHLKIGETLEEVLRREILEEIQCEISEFDSQAVVLVGPPNIDLEDDYYLAAKIAETAFGRHKILLRPLQSEIPDSEIAGNKIYYFIDCEIRGRPKKTIYTSRIYFCKPIEAIWMASNHDLKIQPVEGAFLRLLAEGRSFLRISK